MNKLVLTGAFQELIDRKLEWFEPRDGVEQLEKQAWRAIAYYLAGVNSGSKSVEVCKEILTNVRF